MCFYVYIMTIILFMFNVYYMINYYNILDDPNSYMIPYSDSIIVTINIQDYYAILL